MWKESFGWKKNVYLITVKRDFSRSKYCKKSQFSPERPHYSKATSPCKPKIWLTVLKCFSEYNGGNPHWLHLLSCPTHLYFIEDQRNVTLTFTDTSTMNTMKQSSSMLSVRPQGGFQAGGRYRTSDVTVSEEGFSMKAKARITVMVKLKILFELR